VDIIPFLTMLMNLGDLLNGILAFRKLEFIMEIIKTGNIGNSYKKEIIIIL